MGRERGQPFKRGTPVGKRIVLLVRELKKPFVMTTYDVMNSCGHTSIKTHKALCDKRSHHTGLCLDCWRKELARKNKEAKGHQDREPKTVLPEPGEKFTPVEGTHDWAQRLMLRPGKVEQT